MSAARFDFEFALPQGFQAYLAAVLSDATTSVSPVVTWFDPMAVDDANRVVVFATRGTAPNNLSSNCDMSVEIGVKSRWAQKTLAADIAAHGARLSDVRNALLEQGLAGDADLQVPGMGIINIDNTRQYESDVIDNGWIISKTTLTVSVFAKAS